MNAEKTSERFQGGIAMTTEEQLKVMIDASSLEAVLSHILDICHGKVDHLRSNWQDEIAARAWERVARRIENLNTEGL